MQHDQNRRPLFIVFDGLDGTGKSTQLRLLAERLRGEGQKVYTTAEPTAFEEGRRLRRALAGELHTTNSTIAAMFLLDRVRHNVDPDDGIGRHLADGDTVLCDRYYYSSMAYQGQGENFEWVADMNLNCPDIRRPDGCIFFDMEPEESMKRICAGRAECELEIYETVEQQQRIRAQYRRALAHLEGRDRIYVIDAAGTIEEVAAKVWEAYQDILANT